MKIRNILLLSISLPAFLLVSSCGPANVDQLTPEDIKALKDYIASSYYILRGSDELSRTTVYTDADEPGTFEDGTISDFPEMGQKTKYEVDSQGDNIYKITVTTTYTKDDAIDNTVEVYYVKDKDPIGTWNYDDLVVDPDGNTDHTYREKFETTFKDGGVRYEKIAEVFPWDGDEPGYAEFDLDGSLTFPESNFEPEEDDDANWSSKVIYRQEVYKRFAFWNVLNKVIVGARYYTEHGTGINPVKTSVTYERTVQRDYKAQGQGIREFLKFLFGENDEIDMDTATLSETVIRYKIDEDGRKEMRHRSYIVNDFGEDFILTADGGEITLESVN